MPNPRINYVELAKHITSEARKLGVEVYSDRDGVVVTFKTFEPGDRKAYVSAERDCLKVLSMVRTNSPGTTWGTDSGSVGGHVGLLGGYCRLNKSGVVRTLAKQLA